MNDYKTLSIKGALLDKEQLGSYLEKMASDQDSMPASYKETYPMHRVKENFEVISQVYYLLNEHVKLGIPIHPAGEWILDNYYVLEEIFKMIGKELTLKKYMNLPGIANGPFKGFARIYVIASQIVAYTDAKIDANHLAFFLKSYQTKKTLNMEEIWSIGLFMQIALLENIRGICEKIYNSQMQKYKVENIIERLIENKKTLKFKNVQEHKNKLFQEGKWKYTFIEYMSYKLKKYGKRAYPYLHVLEEEVSKTGTELEQVIKKEHFEIAVNKVSMGNSITSIKTLLRMNFLNIFEQINGVEDILKKDPAGVYEKMDFKTKTYYREHIKKISKKTKVSEIYIAKKCLELASRENIEEKETHVGYYIIAEGRQRLLEQIVGKKSTKQKEERKAKWYVLTLFFFTLIIAIGFEVYILQATNSTILAVLLAIATVVPAYGMVKQIVQWLLSKWVKPKLIPKMDFQNGVPKEATTFVVIPTIITSKEKVKKLMEKLEVYYLANKTENLYFALLGDCSASDKKEEPFDNEVIIEGMEMAKKLNEKYQAEELFPKFHFLYRNRIWNDKEECYLGWERKRGLLDQFNHYIVTKTESPFRTNTIEMQKENLPEIKYIITLDADTDLTLHAGLELIGAMAHILNKPKLNKKQTRVIEGYGIIQPRVGIDLNASKTSLFTEIFAGAAGTDSYTNAISDTYQDNFGEGIFTGKGIYDVTIFHTVLHGKIPENTVLSHDLLEGNYLHCGLASDILLMDGYPSTYLNFKTRLHRWIRGDYQILPWLRKPLHFLAKYKIIDNILRSLIEPSILLALAIFIGIRMYFEISILPIFLFIFALLFTPTILSILDAIMGKRDGQIKQKTFTPFVGGIRANILRNSVEIASLPDKAYFSFHAMITSLYRMYKSKKHLLEWTTAEEAEKNNKNDSLSYYKGMAANLVVGVAMIFAGVWLSYISLAIIGIVWILAPFAIYQISKKRKEKDKLEEISSQDATYLLDIANRTWLYFKENLTQKGNFLPPDNYQEDREEKIVYRTSPTNIGLAMLAVIASYDLKFEKLEKVVELLQKMVDSIERLPKWNGHLYNWYNTITLEPLVPEYISTVDSGNFVGYLYVAKQFIEELEEKKFADAKENLKERIQGLIDKTDFSKLYDEENRLFSIGFSIEENKLTDSYYDLLASEARQASFVAIAKRDISPKHWDNLSRTLTSLNHYKGLISWSGTAFEYLMPNINIPQYPGSLLDESCKFMVMSQKEYTKKLGIPWGISEAAFNLKDLNNHYQYKAFGIPWLGLKRGLENEMVVSAYGCLLALSQAPKDVLENIKRLEKEQMLDKYGFYESIDYTPNRLKKEEHCAVVKTYMAHHQGLILLSINNLLNSQILQKRFMKNPEMQAIEILLQERMPENIVITKEKKEKVEKIKYVDYENYTQRIYNQIEPRKNIGNVIANENYTIVMDQMGNGYSKFGNIYVNRYWQDDEEMQGIPFFFKNIKKKRIWSNHMMPYLGMPDKYSIRFAPDSHEMVRIDGNIETKTKVIVAPNESVEIRRAELSNQGNEPETIEVTSYFEPVLSTILQDTSHRAFNNLFLQYEWNPEISSIIIRRKAKAPGDKDIYLAVSFYAIANAMGELEFEIDKEKLVGRGNLELPKAIENSLPFSNKIGYVVDPIVAMKRTVLVPPEQKVTIDLVLAVGEEKEKVIEMVKKYAVGENRKQVFELSRARIEAENRYLGFKGKQIENYQNLLFYILNRQNSLKVVKHHPKQAYKSMLWKYGISGDLPIVLVRIQDVNDIDVVDEILNAYEYYRLKNIAIDLVILDEEKKSYESYVKDMAQSSILNKNMAYLCNKPGGGIFILHQLENKEKEVLLWRSNFIIEAHLGNLELQLKDLEEEKMAGEKELPNLEVPALYEIEEREKETWETEDLQFYNEYGGFSKDGKEYRMCVNKHHRLPTVWSHLLANPNFGTLVTESQGGYTWYKNSRVNRITKWSNNAVVDAPSECLYLQEEESRKTWSLGLNPMPDEQDYHVTYGFGYAKYEHKSLGIKQKLEMYVPIDENVKVNFITLKNTEPRRKKLRIFYYMRPVLGEKQEDVKGFLQIDKVASNVLLVQNIGEETFHNKVYITSSENIESFTGDSQIFIGRGTLANPEGVKKVNLGNKNNIKENSIVVLEFSVVLEAYANKEIVINLGAEESGQEAKDKAFKYASIGNCKAQYHQVKKYWNELLNRLQIQTPILSTNILMNGWIMYQTIVARLWARTGFYQSGGAFGFRDQLQDVIATKYIEANLMKKQILKHASHQFVEGDVEHWWHEETKRGIRTRFSDDRLWLPFVASDYIAFTGNKAILEEMVPFRKGEPLPEGIDERYDKYEVAEETKSLYEHCIRAIEISLKFGKNGLPTIGSGDWNDGFSTVGNKGEGESVWLGFFLCKVLQEFIPICKEKEDVQRAERYEQILVSLKKALNQNAWDGRWYKRAFMDSGEVLGSIENEECRIDNIAQSWAVISGMGDNDKKFICMESLENHLVDRENGLIKLLDPPFENGKLKPGYIKSYLPGTRENGGQYTHAAVWTIIAEALLGFGEKAVEYYKMISPVEHARTKEGVHKYKAEPYVIPADIYGRENLAGRGGWTWYTGSSSWMYEACLKYILGFTIKDGRILQMNPHVPKDWKEYSIFYQHGNSRYHIKVVQEGHREEQEVWVNGVKQEKPEVILQNDGRVYQVEVKI